MSPLSFKCGPDLNTMVLMGGFTSHHDSRRLRILDTVLNLQRSSLLFFKFNPHSTPSSNLLGSKSQAGGVKDLIQSLPAMRPNRSWPCSSLHRMRRLDQMNTRTLGSNILERQSRF